MESTSEGKESHPSLVRIDIKENLHCDIRRLARCGESFRMPCSHIAGHFFLALHILGDKRNLINWEAALVTLADSLHHFQDGVIHIDALCSDIYPLKIYESR